MRNEAEGQILDAGGTSLSVIQILRKIPAFLKMHREGHCACEVTLPRKIQQNEQHVQFKEIAQIAFCSDVGSTQWVHELALCEEQVRRLHSLVTTVLGERAVSLPKVSFDSQASRASSYPRAVARQVLLEHCLMQAAS